MSKDHAPTVSRESTESRGSTDASAEDHRKRPRRRGEALNAAIYAATLAELTEAGYSGLTMERVAERARASKASLYRRWPSKAELVINAVYHVLSGPESIPDTGSLRGDLLAMFRDVAAQLAGPAGQGLRGLLSDALRDPRRIAEIRSHTRGHSMSMVREVVRRAALRGEVDADRITERQLETGTSVIRFHFLIHGSIPDEVIIGVVDEVVLPLFRTASRPDEE